MATAQKGRGTGAKSSNKEDCGQLLPMPLLHNTVQGSEALVAMDKLQQQSDVRELWVPQFQLPARLMEYIPLPVCEVSYSSRDLGFLT